MSETPDSQAAPESLQRDWRALWARLACAAGALTALVSLLVGAPVWVAALRGALLHLAILVLGRAGLWALARAAAAEAGAPADAKRRRDQP